MTETFVNPTSLFKSKKSKNGIVFKGFNIIISDNKAIISNNKTKKEILINDGFTHEIINDRLFVYNTKSKAFAGTDFSNIESCVNGLITPYKESVSMRGSGYKLNIKSDELVLDIGFTTSRTVKIPAGISITQDKTQKSTAKENILVMILTSDDMKLLTKFASELEALKKPDPYKRHGVSRDSQNDNRRAKKEVKK